jgi:hypothetical protein
VSVTEQERFCPLLKPGEQTRAAITVKATDKLANSDNAKRTEVTR